MNAELHDELISAALDGERVDVEALRAALATEDGRATLAAFVLLRAATSDDDIVPAARYEQSGTPAVWRRPVRMAAVSRVPAAWAASIAILAVAASFWFGLSLRAPATAVSLTPPTSVVLAQPRVPGPIFVDRAAGDGRPTRENSRKPAARLARVAAQPPTPTRVLRFVPGVDWISTPE